jgi:hypothetical protein
MKIISILRGLSTGAAADAADLERKAQWIRDPLAHPDLDAMSERELADLPFARGARSGRGTDACRA